MMTQQDREWMARRSELTPPESDALESTWGHVADEARIAGIKPAMDDRAACLEAALVRYLIESRTP